MTTKEFVNKIVKELFQKYKKLIVLYEYKENSQTHFLKVIPKSIYDSGEFKELYSNYICEFIDNNFEGSLCIITEDSAVSLDDAYLYISSDSDSMNIEENNNHFQTNNINSNKIALNIKDNSNIYCLAA